MRLVLDVAGGLQQTLKDAGDNLAAVLTNAVAAAGAELQQMLRDQVRSAGLGPGLEKAWRYEAYRRASAPARAPLYLSIPRQPGCTRPSRPARRSRRATPIG